MIRRLLPLSYLLLALARPLCAQDVQGLVLPFKSVTVSSPVLQEVIDQILVDEGDSVQEGQPIVQLRKSKEALAVREGEELVKNAEFVSDGLTKMAKENIGSREQALKAQTDLELAKIRLATAKELLDEKTVRAPLSGIVVKKYKESGESVDRAEKILDLVNIDKLYAQFYLEPRFLPTLKVDEPITLQFTDLKGDKVNGKISFLDPRIDASSGLFRVKVLFENGEHKVKAGMKALADFSKKG